MGLHAFISSLEPAEGVNIFKEKPQNTWRNGKTSDVKNAFDLKVKMSAETGI